MFKRYLVFGYQPYARSGGWNDFIGDYDHFVEAEEAAEEWQVWQIVDTAQGQVDRS